MFSLLDGFNAWSLTIIYVGALLSISLFSIHYFIVPRSSIRNLRGPPSQSWFLGNIRELESSVVGDCEFRWAEEYGQSYGLRGGYGEDLFMTSDPKALQILLQTSSYNVIKPPSALQRSSNLLGNDSILSVEGHIHKRCRRVMLPAFGLPETKALVHVFQAKASKLSSQWKALMNGSESFETNVHRWLTGATLDAIGEGKTNLHRPNDDETFDAAAFDYQFRAMDDSDNILGKIYRDMFILAARPSCLGTAWGNFTTLLSRPLARFIDVPTRTRTSMNKAREITREVAGKLFDAKWSVLDHGNERGKRDVISLLVKANMIEDERTKFTRQEVIDQMGTIIFAGHETTANMLAWSLWELSKNHNIQKEVRDEVLKFSRKYSDETIPVTEYDDMVYTLAFIKEVFRMHPIIPKIVRHAAKDLVVPLHDPILDKAGNTIHQLCLRKKMRFFVNIVAYNRHPDLWGSNPHDFRPERWFELEEGEGKHDTKFGVFGNLGTFGAGIHACIGWRFALYEIQAFLISMVQNFEFDLPNDGSKVRRTYAFLMVPQVEGEDKHVTMPLKISAYKSQCLSGVEQVDEGVRSAR